METQYKHAIVGILESGEIVCLNYVFNDQYGRGAVGSLFVEVSAEEIDAKCSIEYVQEYWEDSTGELFTDNEAKEFLADSTRDFPFQNNSYSEHYETIKDTLGLAATSTLECVGGGRCIHKEMKFQKIFNQALLDLALSYED